MNNGQQSDSPQWTIEQFTALIAKQAKLSPEFKSELTKVLRSDPAARKALASIVSDAETVIKNEPEEYTPWLYW